MNRVAGDFDFFVTIFEDNTGGWYFLLPEGTSQTVPSLELPSSLSIYTFPAFGTPKGYGVYDVKAITDYEGLKSYIRQSKRGLDTIFDIGGAYTSVTYITDSSGGRVSKPSHRSMLGLNAK